MQLPAPIQVRVQWRAAAEVPLAIRKRVDRELATLAWELSQAEALLHDAARLASGPRAFLMPRIELRLPLYEERRRLRIVFTHVEKPEIAIADEAGKRLADIRLA